MAGRTCQKVFFEDEDDNETTFIDEGDATEDANELVFSDDEVFVGDNLELICNIADTGHTG